MEPGRLDRVRIDVAGEMVEISWRERDMLLEELAFVEGTKAIREKLEAVGASRPVELDDEERSRLRRALEQWDRDVVQPDGLDRLHRALMRAGSPGGSAGPSFE
jgi:hypothetical protein